MKRIVILAVLLIGVAGIFFGWENYQQQQRVKAISSFAACAKLFPVMTSYPARCVTSDGRSFTEEIGNELQYHDEILVEQPRPNQVVKSPFVMKGKARGSWFFEGSFSADLYDGKNNHLGTIILTAQGSWMTPDFVPFSGQQTIDDPTTATGMLKIHNANPSGLPEKQKELSMPVRFSP